jgi:hypothetical protein
MMSSSTDACMPYISMNSRFTESSVITESYNVRNNM